MLIAANYILSTIDIPGSNLEKSSRKDSFPGVLWINSLCIIVAIKSLVLVLYMYEIVITLWWTKVLFSHNIEDWDDIHYHIGTDCG